MRRVVAVEKQVELKEAGKRITDTAREAGEASESRAGLLHRAEPRLPGVMSQASEAFPRPLEMAPQDPAAVRTPAAEDSIASPATDRGARDVAGGSAESQEMFEQDSMSSLWQKLARIPTAALTYNPPRAPPVQESEGNRNDSETQGGLRVLQRCQLEGMSPVGQSDDPRQSLHLSAQAMDLSGIRCRDRARRIHRSNVSGNSEWYEEESTGIRGWQAIVYTREDSG